MPDTIAMSSGILSRPTEDIQFFLELTCGYQGRLADAWRVEHFHKQRIYLALRVFAQEQKDSFPLLHRKSASWELALEEKSGVNLA